MSAYQDFKSQLLAYGIDPKYSLGQNFIYDADILNELILLSKIPTDARVVEIGAGFATLTEALCLHLKTGELIAYEIDLALDKRLKDVEAKYEQLSIRLQDARYANFTEDIESMAALQKKKGIALGPIHVIANLPYYLTTEFIEKILVEIKDVESVSVMVQAEVWDRIKALPEDKKLYGPLAVLCHTFGKIEKLKFLPANVFYPAPRVDSVFVHLSRSKDGTNPLKDGDGAAFLKFVTFMFSNRRKTIANNLKSSGFDAARVQRIEAKLIELGLSTTIRAERLTPEQFILLFQVFI